MIPFEHIGPLFTDLYELTMAAGYFEYGMADEATFSLFVRPGGEKTRAFYIAAGLEDVLEALGKYRFSAKDISYLKSTGMFSSDFLACLSRFRFTGDVHALPEGTVFFPEEPILEVTAPIMEAQILESYILNTVGFQIMIATKAARCVLASEGRSLLDFSLRRTHGFDSSLKAARSSYLAGFAGTSNVLAGEKFGIPLSGTMAHSFVMAFHKEADAFAAFAKTFPNNAIFLIDTYDTLKGAQRAVQVARSMNSVGRKLLGVRLDSGDMVDLSRKVRCILDEGGQQEVKILASGDLDEYRIQEIIGQGAKIDAFGIGTKMGVSADAPYLDIVYKMVQIDGRNVRKLSSDKKTLAGEKQVFRKVSENGEIEKDVIGLREEQIPGTQPLLETVMKGGRCAPHTRTTLEKIRKRASENLAHLDEKYKKLKSPETFPVELSSRLKSIQKTPTKS